MILVPLGGPIHEWLCLGCYSMAATSGVIDPELIEAVDDYVARSTELDR